MHLLPLHALIPTGPVDHADWNYRPLLGTIQRLRFQLVCRLLPAKKLPRLLEIGYGSGVFLPELARHCQELHGIDIHPHAAAVENCLREHGVTARLIVGSTESLPYEDASFDGIVAVSSLEFIPDIVAAANEMHRVLKPAGNLIVVTPGHSPLVDAGLKLLTGKSAKQDYAGRRERLLPALYDRFEMDAQRTFPPVLGRIAPLYTALRLGRELAHNLDTTTFVRCELPNQLSAP